MEMLTERQSSILEYLKDRIIEGKIPSFREIRDRFRFKGIKAVSDHLDALERKGYIRRDHGKARAIEILGLRKLDPLILPVIGRIAAGSPILAEENIEGTIAVDKAWVRDKNSFVLKVQGDSMIGVGIFDGDYAVIRQDYTAENRSIVAIMIGEEVTLKRFYKTKDQITLKPENEFMEPIVIKKGDARVKIIGKLIGIYRQVIK